MNSPDWERHVHIRPDEGVRQGLLLCPSQVKSLSLPTITVILQIYMSHFEIYMPCLAVFAMNMYTLLITGWAAFEKSQVFSRKVIQCFLTKTARECLH